MQTMQHEHSGLPDTSYEETPLLSGSIRDADIERRLNALRQDPRTGIIDTTQMMDASINPLSDEDRAKQIEMVKKLIKLNYPKAKVDSLVITFSKKKPMDIVVLGPKGGEEKVVKNEDEETDNKEEIKRKDQLIKNLENELKTEQKERKELKKNKIRSTNFNQAFLKKKEKEMRLKKIFTAQKLLML